jgi:hypothetical protein
MGVTRHVLANIRQHLGQNRHDLASEASHTIAARLSSAEQEAISILITADATAMTELG